MKNFFSSTLLLGTATVIHASRIMVLSFLLGNAAFGAVSTIMLTATLFVEFGGLGFSQLIYNQSLFTPGKVSKNSRRIGLYFVTGVMLLLVTAIIVSITVAALSEFSFSMVFLTVFCSASNMLVLAACRSSKSSFTHPIGFIVKAFIIVTDIVVLGSFTPPVGEMALWGEVIAFPVLLIYAWHVGILKVRWTIVREVPNLLTANIRLGGAAIVSASSGMLFFSQERLFGVAALTFEQLGILTKLLLPKLIAAQGAFLLGVHFHRMIVRKTEPERIDLFSRIRKIEWLGVPSVLFFILIGGYVVVFLASFIYKVEVDYVTGSAVTMLAILFFFNPYSIMLQATNRYGSLACANVIALCAFVVSTWTPAARDLGPIVLSAFSALLWFVIIRILVGRTFNPRDLHQAS